MPIFGYGDMRLYLLKLLAEAPRYGYELIRLLEERFLGAYVPSAGAIYPRLSALEEEGFITHDTEDGRKVYRITDKGEQELTDRGDEIDNLEQRVADWAGGLAESVMEGVKPLIEGLGATFGGDHGERDELLRKIIVGRDDAIRKIRRRNVTRDIRGFRTLSDEDREVIRRRRREGSGRGDDTGTGLRGDLRAFADDVSASARRNPPDKETRRKLQQLLLDTRHQIDDLLEAAAPPKSAEPTEPAQPEGAPTEESSE